MTFGHPLPPWAVVAVLAAAIMVSWLAYRRVGLRAPRRAALSTLRLATLLWLVFCLMRPLARATAATATDAIVPILVDTSRSMGLADADGARRIDRARELLERDLRPALAPVAAAAAASTPPLSPPSVSRTMPATGRPR